MELPRISSYGQYSSDNYGAHTLRVELPGITLYFSYHTVIAFRGRTYGLRVSENLWGPTTGKHLNWISDDKSRRVSREEFERSLKEELAVLGYQEAV
jgi:hypothetical protein